MLSVAAAAALAGAASGPRVRAAILRRRTRAAEPRRTCPVCEVPILPAHRGRHAALLPPSGRCPRCASRIGPPAVTVELATAAVFAGLAVRVRPVPLLVALCWLAAVCLVLAVVDAGVQRLPDALTVPAGAGLLAGLAVTAAVERQPAALLRAVAAGTVLSAAYLAVAALRPGALGAGDGKLAAVLGCALGWFGWAPVLAATVAAHTLAAVHVLGRLAVLRRADPVAFGPFLVLGALAAVLLAA